MVEVQTEPQGVKPKLGRNLSVVLLPLVIIPSIVILILVLFRIQSHLRQVAINTMFAAARGNASSFELMIGSQEQWIESIAADPNFLDLVQNYLSSPANQGSSLEDELSVRRTQNTAAQNNELLLVQGPDGIILIATNPDLTGNTLEVQFELPESPSKGVIVTDGTIALSTPITLGAFKRLALESSLGEELFLVSLTSNKAFQDLSLQLTRMGNTIDPTGNLGGRTLIAISPNSLYSIQSDGSPTVIGDAAEHPVFNELDSFGSQSFTYKTNEGQAILGVTESTLDGRLAIIIERADVTLIESLSDFLPVVLLVLLALTLFSAYTIYQSTNRTLQPLTSKGDWDYRVDEGREDEVGQLGSSLNLMAEELGTLYQSLESRVEERTKHIRTASEVARAVISIPNLDELLRQAVRLIKDRFGYDHVSIFLLDKDGANAILRETTSSTDEALKTVGHRLEVGSSSIVGQVTESNQPRIASDTDSDQKYSLDELLPGAHSEVAIPLQITGKSLGALAIQSYETDTFQKGDIEVLQTLADQLSAAIENARLAQVSTNAAERARLVSEITGQISGLMDPDQVLRTTALALHKALGEVEVEVRLSMSQDRITEGDE
jgi:putative methionine-R-sulfoxide reductase with GAF domain